MTASGATDDAIDLGDEIVDSETALSSITLTADEIVALRTFHPTAPGIGMEDEAERAATLARGD